MEKLKDTLFQTVTGHAWKKIGVHTHHGINFPLASLHSEKSCGIGEFFDLIPMIDWCQRLKIDFIQLLPLNDSGMDPSPYHAISSCALHFIYLSLHALPNLDKFPQLKKKLDDFKPFNHTDRIAYAQVQRQKLEWLRIYFDEIGETITKDKDFDPFIEKNPWIKPFALFKMLQDHLGGTSWADWPVEFRSLSPENVELFFHRYKAECTFYLVLQFLCFNQLKKVKEYANANGVFLMGDCPFLMSRDSVDVWQSPEFFNLELSGGAPPDYYNSEGQNWESPIYRWDHLKKRNFIWWKQRLKWAENFFNLFRLDHVLGFFRIWGIPPEKSSKEGHFIPEDQKIWEIQGKELLTMVASSTSMLPIGEDLGTVPEMVRPCLKELGICGTKVMRWERKWEEDKRFLPIQYYPPISITCVSTHDSETLTLWWKNFSEEAKDFAAFKHWTYSSHLTDLQREEILWDSHHTTSLFHVNLLQEYLAFFPELSWPHPEDERINIPGKILSTNWTYRFRPSVESMISHQGLFSKMEAILFSPTPPLSQ